MAIVNIHDQALRYSNMRQMDREYISDFKTRFDNQIKSNEGVGMAPVSDAMRAMDIPGAYPATLAAAFRVASSWTKDGAMIPMGEELHSAFLADNTFSGKAKYNPRERKNIEEVECYVCGKLSHEERRI
jgi:hypothetical protein